MIDEGPEAKWDCESVLSLRSNLDNHPGVISEQSSRRYKPASGRIKLAAKTGQITHLFHVSALWKQPFANSKYIDQWLTFCHAASMVSVYMSVYECI